MAVEEAGHMVPMNQPEVVSVGVSVKEEKEGMDGKRERERERERGREDFLKGVCTIPSCILSLSGSGYPEPHHTQYSIHYHKTDHQMKGSSAGHRTLTVSIAVL